MRWRNIRYVRWRWENCNFSAWWECVWCQTDSWSHGHKSNKHWIWTELKTTMMTRMLWKILTYSYNHNVIVEAKKRRDCKAGFWDANLSQNERFFICFQNICVRWKYMFCQLNWHSFINIIKDRSEQRSTFICCLSPRLRDSLYIATNSWCHFWETYYHRVCDKVTRKAINLHFLFIVLHVTIYTHSICALTICESQLPNTNTLRIGKCKYYHQRCR